mmetsp:Transcript_47008/g.52373  ORF Transcript_47008/g.52373 Transcript_47008/m.52373 type:complete len:118 (+) Transcript_47008:140-493(+)
MMTLMLMLMLMILLMIHAAFTQYDFFLSADFSCFFFVGETTQQSNTIRYCTVPVNATYRTTTTSNSSSSRRRASLCVCCTQQYRPVPIEGKWWYFPIVDRSLVLCLVLPSKEDMDQR